MRRLYGEQDEDDEPADESSRGDISTRERLSLFSNKAKDEKSWNDRDYTHEAMIGQLGLMELHIKDGSYRECTCNPEKHLPVLAGLASEGSGFTEDPDEKVFMQRVRDTARNWRTRIKAGLFTEEDAAKLGDWAREQRHRIEYKVWLGEMPENPELDPQLCPTCVITPQDYLKRMR